MAKELKKFKFTKKIKPELATLVSEAPAGDDWIHEMKFDGYRLISIIHNDIKIYTRNQNDWTSKFSEIVAELKKLKLKDAILDGEVVAYEKGKPSFQALQNSLSEGLGVQLVYHVFDILALNGRDLAALDILARKKILRQAIAKANKKIIRFSDHIQGLGKKTFNEACKLGFEGIVSKHVESTYVQKRTRDWLKVKCSSRQEFIVVAYTKPKGSRSFFGALLLGYYDKGKLRYAGRVGTGFNDLTLKSLHTLLHKYEIKTCPLDEPFRSKDIQSWLKPHIVVEVEFTEWTSEGILRHPSFKGVRKDKKAEQVVREKKQ